jgi:molybdopterin-guanine dinucleotide biosynthesis protein A
MAEATREPDERGGDASGTPPASDARPASAARVAALVLAGRRAPDEVGPGTASVKALEPVDGVPMLERVVTTLAAAADVGTITVCAGDPALLRATPALAALADAGRLRFHAAVGSPAASVADFLARAGDAVPLLVTAADHALLTPEMVRHFLEAARAAAADVAVAVVSAAVFRRRFPAVRRTFVPFADAAVSGANLFLFATPGAARAARFWVRAESFRKRPWRMVAVFGPVALLRFALRRLDVAAAAARASAAMGARLVPIFLPFAESAIDVDTPADLALAASLLAARRQSVPASSSANPPPATS